MAQVRATLQKITSGTKWLKYGPHSKKNQKGAKQLNEGLFG